MAKKANPRIVVYGEAGRGGWWSIRVEIGRNDLDLCDRGEGVKTWSRKSLALAAAQKLRDVLDGIDSFAARCPIEVEE